MWITYISFNEFSNQFIIYQDIIIKETERGKENVFASIPLKIHTKKNYKETINYEKTVESFVCAD